MEKPVASKKYAGVPANNGEFTIIELSAVVSSEDNNNEPDQTNTGNQIAQTEYQRLLQVLTDQAEVVRTPIDELDDY